VDTNKLFSSLLSSQSKTLETLLDSDNEFYAPNFLVLEIFKYKEKILKISKLDNQELYQILRQLLARLEFVNEKRISTENLIHAYRLCNDIDEKDIPFVALTLELDGKLWTGDEELKRGLLKKGFTFFFDPTEEF
jgi:predicted nucleic acid-binding protein